MWIAEIKDLLANFILEGLSKTRMEKKFCLSLKMATNILEL